MSLANSWATDPISKKLWRLDLHLLMAKMLVLSDGIALYHLNHATLGSGLASNLPETVHSIKELLT